MNKPINKSNFFIFTGAPGSGKTSVLNELHNRGYSIVPEVAREIIKAQRAIGGDATHTGNRDAFRDLMLEQSITDFQKMLPINRLVFFDRGIPDLVGYSKQFCGKTTVKTTQSAQQYRYNSLVFLFPPWPEIYSHDTERQQDFQEAIETYQAIKQAYSACKYNVVEVPKVPVNNRVDFILQITQ